MSFVGKAIRGIGKAVGLIPKTPKMPAMLPAPTAAALGDPMAAPTGAPGMDSGAQAVAALSSRTSTLLTGGTGEDRTKLNTSRVLLGS